MPFEKIVRLSGMPAHAVHTEAYDHDASLTSTGIPHHVAREIRRHERYDRD